MVWWQGLLIVIGLIVVAVPVGLLIGYIILRIQKRPWPFSRNRAREILNTEKTDSSTELRDSLREYQDKLDGFLKKRQGLMAAEKQVRLEKSEALKEVETNLAIAKAVGKGKPAPFQTSVWDNKDSEFNSLGPDLRSEMAEAYTDMRLANDIVWLITEVGRDNKNLEESYAKLCASVAERLQRLMPLLKEAVQKRISA